MRRWKVRAGAWQYYDSAVARGAEDYYAGGGEAPGRWWGAEAAALGLAEGTEVTTEHLARLFGQGTDPLTGQALGQTWHGEYSDGRQSTTGFDCTFSAPKSVSILWGAGDEQTRAQAKAAHDAAVSAALAYLQRSVAHTRVGKHDALVVDAEGLAVARFDHRTSRAHDPQLHTHCLVSAKVRGPDGEWRSLDARMLIAHTKAAGMTYQAALRAEMTERLGVQWSPTTEHGQADVIGVPKELLEHWSKRSEAIAAKAEELEVELVAKHDRPLTAAERDEVWRVAWERTRATKGAPESDAGLHERWEAEATALGWSPERLRDATHDRAQAVDARPEAERIEDAVHAASAKRAAWGQWHLVEQLARGAGHSATTRTAADVLADLERLRDTALRHTNVHEATMPSEGPTRRSDGRAEHVAPNNVRYTDSRHLQQEASVLDYYDQGRGHDRGGYDAEVLAREVEARTLTEEQAEAVAHAVGPDLLSGIVGAAGAGKTHLLGAAVAAWEAAGRRVVPLAPSSGAVRVLSQGLGREAQTIDAWLARLERQPELERRAHEARQAVLDLEHRIDDRDRRGGDPIGAAMRAELGRRRRVAQDAQGQMAANAVQRSDVIVVDEAGMLSTALAARLIEQARGAGAKVVLVGDHHQLSSVEVGGLFGHLAERIEGATTEVSANKRIEAGWEKEAAGKLRHGDEAVLSTYIGQERVHGGDVEGCTTEMVNRWIAARGRGQSCAVMAGTNAMADTISTQAREWMVGQGKVLDGDDVVVVGRSGIRIGPGEEVLSRSNDYQTRTDKGQPVRNGDAWVVERTHDDGSITVRSLDKLGRVTLGAEYVRENITYAYAATIHRSQGASVDVSLSVAGQSTDRHGLYVAMTRGRHENHVWGVTDDGSKSYDPTQERLGVDDPDATAASIIRAAMRRGGDDRAWHSVLADVAAQAAPAKLRERLAAIEMLIPNRPGDGTVAELVSRIANVERIASAAREGAAPGLAAKLAELRSELAAVHTDRDRYDEWAATPQGAERLRARAATQEQLAKAEELEAEKAKAAEPVRRAEHVPEAEPVSARERLRQWEQRRAERNRPTDPDRGVVHEF